MATDTVYGGGVATTYNNGKAVSTAPDTVNPTPPTPSPSATSVNQPPNQTQLPAATPAPATQPVSVVSSNAAATHLNNVVVPALQQAQTDLATHNANTQATKAAAAAAPAPVQEQAQQPTPSDQAAQQIANTPEAGNQFVWSKDGNRLEVPIGSAVPPGYSTTQTAPNPVTQNTPMVSHFMDTQGNTYADYGNGQYGMIDSNGNYSGQISANDFQNAQANSPEAQLQQAKALVGNITQSLTMLQNGSYPLSSSQQAVINGLQTEMQADVQTQELANQNLTGGTTVAMNLYGMGNTLTGLGMIKSTIDSGVQKVLDIQSKAASAVAQMVEGFNKDNLDMLKTAYDVYDNSVQEIQKGIDDMTAQVRQNKLDIANQQHQDFTDFMSSENFNLTQKQDAFDNYIKQATLTEQQKNDAFDQWYKTQDIALRQQAANPYQAGGTGPVPLTGNGAPSKAAQAAFLAQFPATTQTQIKGLTSYTLLPTSFPTRAAKGEMDRATAVALAKQYDPTYDENLAASRQKTATTYSDGTSKPSVSITALNTAAGHLATLASDEKQMGNVGFEPLNAVKNTVGSVLGLKGTAGPKTDIAAVTGELATAFKSSGATDSEIKALGSISADSSPKQVQSYVEAATALMGSKLGALQDSYTASMGTPPPSSFLHPTAVNDLLQLQSKGYNINVPQLDQTPPVQLKNFVAADPTTNTAVYNEAKNAVMQVNGGQQPSADDIYQLLQQEGYVQ